MFLYDCSHQRFLKRKILPCHVPLFDLDPKVIIVKHRKKLIKFGFTRVLHGCCRRTEDKGVRNLHWDFDL